MIHLLVDEAYAFDYLSILKVKSDIKKNDFYYQQVCSDMEKRYSNKEYKSSFVDVLNSEEYKSLVECNRQIFDKIDLIRSGDSSITAREIDDLNMKRFYVKNSLQEKFFTNLMRAEEKL